MMSRRFTPIALTLISAALCSCVAITVNDVPGIPAAASATASPSAGTQTLDGGSFTLKIPATWRKADLTKLNLPQSDNTKAVAGAVNGTEESPETMLVVYGATFPADVISFPAAVDVMKKTFSQGGNTIKKEFKNTSGDVFGFTVGMAGNAVESYIFMARNGDKWYMISVVTGGSIKEDDVLTLVNSFRAK